MLWHQEVHGKWLCLVCFGNRTRIVRDFPHAVELIGRCHDFGASRIGEVGELPLVAILPSVCRHVSEDVCVRVGRPISVFGLSLPAPGPRSPVLRFKRLEISVEGVVELRNLIIVGGGTHLDQPQGVCDSAVYVVRGTCKLVDSEVYIAQGHAGFGVAVGSVKLHAAGRANAVLLRTQVRCCSTGCVAYLGGHLAVGPGSSIAECGTGVSVCDGESVAIIDPKASVACEGGLQFQVLSGGVVRHEIVDIEQAAADCSAGPMPVYGLRSQTF